MQNQGLLRHRGCSGGGDVLGEGWSWQNTRVRVTGVEQAGERWPLARTIPAGAGEGWEHSRCQLRPAEKPPCWRALSHIFLCRNNLQSTAERR